MYWYSPIPLNIKLRDKLKDLNINQINNIKDTNQNILLIYNPPDIILEYIYTQSEIDNFNLSDLIEYYQSFNNINLKSNLKLIAGWSIENLEGELIKRDIDLNIKNRLKKSASKSEFLLNDFSNRIIQKRNLDNEMNSLLNKHNSTKEDLKQINLDLTNLTNEKNNILEKNYALKAYSFKLEQDIDSFYEKNLDTI